MVALTYRCNLKCVTCDLAEKAGAENVTPAVLGRLPASLRYINLSGGEPFLRDDVVACARAAAAACPRAVITISTNGSLPARAEEAIRDLRAAEVGVRVSVSVDGLEATHDRTRQTPGSFVKALETIDRLRPILGRDVHMAFTLSAANAGELEGVAALALGRGLPLSLAFVHTSEHYFRPREDVVPAGEEARAAIRAAVRYYLRRLSPRAAARAYFAAGFQCLLTGEKRPLPCRAGERFFYLDAAANVYGCNMRADILGNLAAESWEPIWGAAARRAFLPTTGDACPVQCWMVCTARTSIQDARARVGWWAARAYPATWLGGAPPHNCRP